MRQILVALLLISLIGPAMAQQPLARPEIGPRVGRAAPPVGEHFASPLDSLADQPYRPPWAPIPVLWGGTAAAPTLLTLLASEDAAERVRAAFLLGQIAWQGSADRLAGALSDPSRRVRLHAGIALTCLGDARGRPAAVAALVGQPDWVKVYAVLGLWRLDSSIARALMAQQAGAQSPFIRSLIEGALDSAPMLPPPAQPPDLDAPRPSVSEVIDEAISGYMLETDWWWHNGGVYDQCIRCMETALLLDPQMANVYGDIAWLAWSMGQDTQAIGALHRGIQTNPDALEAWFYLGQHYFITKRFAPAEPYLRKAAELGGGRLEQGVYAHCLTNLGRLEESLAVWERIVEQHPTDGAAIYNRDKVKAILDRP